MDGSSRDQWRNHYHVGRVWRGEEVESGSQMITCKLWDKSRLRLVCRLSQVSTHLVIGLKEEIYGKN